MGNPIDLRFIPIFVAKEIFDFPGFPGHRVVVGEEDACSFYTKVAIVEGNGTVSNGDIDKLREDLKNALSNRG